MNFARPLVTNRLAQPFVEGILGIKDSDSISAATRKIASAEMHLSQISDKSTLKFDEYRDSNYVDDLSRKKLRETIFKELVSNKRITKDDNIRLGIGGALPNTSLTNNRQAYIITGLPASGKSGISSIIADQTGSVILDSDYAKRKFPEFEDQYGASLVHDESAIVVFGDENDSSALSVKGFCVGEGYNVVIPKIGNTPSSVLDLALFFKKYDYDVHLTLIDLDRQIATERAFGRFIKSGRYVSLSLIFDVFSNDPIVTYYKIKDSDTFKSYGSLSTDVAEDSPPKVIEGSTGNPSNFNFQKQ